MAYKSAVVVLIGAQTASRPWVGAGLAVVQGVRDLMADPVEATSEVTPAPLKNALTSRRAGGSWRALLVATDPE